MHLKEIVLPTRSLLICLVLLSGSATGCARQFESLNSRPSPNSTSSSSELSEQNYEKLSKEITRLEETGAEIFKKIIERIPTWQDDAALIERRLSYIEAKLSEFETSRAAASSNDSADKVIEKRSDDIEDTSAKPSADETLSGDSVFKAILEESVVPVQVGSPITIAFPHSIAFGFRTLNDLYTLEREEDKVTITTNSKLPDSGVPLLVKLQDSSVFLVRLVNASKRTPAQSSVFIGDSDYICGGVWYDQDAW